MRYHKIILLVTTFIAVHTGFACTDFRVRAQDGTVLIARSMEYAIDMKSNLRTSNRGRTMQVQAPNGMPGMSWTAKYGYVFLDGFNVDVALDGMNEKGLSFEALYLPLLAQYQTVPAGHEKQALPYINIGDWILGSFSTVDEVREALSNIYVYAAKMPDMGDMIFPLHFSIYDSSGKGIVVEYINGKLNVHDNEVGVLTNSPSYDWHIANLANYIHLAPVNPSPVIDDSVKFVATGQGFGMIGMPGDISPPSRFVKMATLLRVAIPAKDAVQALNLAGHVINNVDIPLGLARASMEGKPTSEQTQWVVFKDLTHHVFYYRTYTDFTLRSVTLAKINFSQQAPRLKMSIDHAQLIQDMTDSFTQAQ